MIDLKRDAVAFLEAIIRGDIAQAYETYVADGCIHHNPYFKGDMATLQAGMEESHIQSPDKVYEVKHVLQDGNMVAVHAFMKQNKADKTSGTVVHMFRFNEAGKVVEFWDVAQFVEEIINENGLH